MDYSIFLHIELKKSVHAEFEKLPQNAYRHRETERYYRCKYRRKLEKYAVTAVEQLHQRESYRSHKEAVQCVQHSIPVREDRVKVAELAEYLCGEYERKQSDLENCRKFYLECDLHEARDCEEDECKQAQKRTFKIPVEYREDHYHDNEGSENIVCYK